MGFREEIYFRDKEQIPVLLARRGWSRREPIITALRYVAHGVTATGRYLARTSAIRAASAPKRPVKCGHFLREFCAGAQEYDVLFTEALVIRRRCPARSSRAKDSLASVTPGPPWVLTLFKKITPGRFN